MDEQAVLKRLADRVPMAGDDAAVVDGLVVTTDMLHQSTDFPQGTTRYTAGWRAVGASLSDVAAMGAEAVATVAVYGAPEFEWDQIELFVSGAMDVSTSAGGAYVGGDLDQHEEFTVATTAIGRTDQPVYRRGASSGEVVCVTGTLGRTAAALAHFQAGNGQRGNELFQFTPRVSAGKLLAGRASAMIDSSDGLARSLHQLASASECGFALDTPLPIDSAVDAVAADETDRREMGMHFGEDFELVCTVPRGAVADLQDDLDVSLTPIGEVTESGVTLDGKSVPDRGYSHG